MTKEECIKVLQALWRYKDCGYPENEIRESLDMVIRALEQEPCEDAVSRESVIELMNMMIDKSNSFDYYDIENETLEEISNLSSVIPTHTETVTEFADRCVECGNEYGKQLKQLERIKERYAEEREILLNSNSEHTTNNVLDIIDYIIHGD